MCLHSFQWSQRAVLWTIRDQPARLEYHEQDEDSDQVHTLVIVHWLANAVGGILITGVGLLVGSSSIGP